MNELPDKIVYFVRHGQSEGNISDVFQSLDSPLTDNGKRQTEIIANRVAKLSFGTLLSSPLTRAKETAEVIAKITNKKPEYSDLFVECIKPTRVMGKSYKDEEAGDLWNEWRKSLHTHGLKVEDGENYDDIIERADRALDFLKNQKENTMVVVTHGFFIQTIIERAILGAALTPEVSKNFQAHIQMENTGLTVLKYRSTYEEHAWLLWIYNDHAHLAD